jgi:hypothetical protein
MIDKNNRQNFKSYTKFMKKIFDKNFDNNLWQKSSILIFDNIHNAS